jgi:hypothetical protein
LGWLRMHWLRAIEIGAKRISWATSRHIADFLDPAAIAFYERLQAGGYEPDRLLKALPAHKLIYVIVPKAASTRIRTTLVRVAGKYARSPRPCRWLHFGTRSPRSMTPSSFFRLATSPQTLRFSFVRNPYARSVSCWAEKFRERQLAGADPTLRMYLATRHEVDANLPAGRDHTLSFPDFVIYATSVAWRRRDSHIQAQADILSMPGITLDLVGKVETFLEDFSRVLEHLRADDSVRRDAIVPLNKSDHAHWPDYYTPELAERIYRAYEPDFDLFGYPRAING